MAVSVVIPTTLRTFADGASELYIEGVTVGEIFANIKNDYPEIANVMFDEEGNLRTFINAFVGDKHIDETGGLDTAVSDETELVLIPAIAGGGGVTESVLSEDTPMESLANDEISRYSRHLLLKEIGVKGQKKLKAAKVLIIGMGGLGAPLAQYLAAAGIGTIGLCDFDAVDVSNLQRQVIYRTRDVKRPKVMAAKDFIKGLNPLVKVETYDYPITADNIADVIADYDVIADATDNFKTRYLINDACVLAGKPDVFGAMFQFEGQCSVFYAKMGPCYRCSYPAPPPPGLVPSCSTGGVMGVLPGTIGTIQANEVIKLIVGGGEPLIGRLLTLDSWKLKFRELKLKKNPKCPICGNEPVIKSIIDFDYDEFCGITAAKKEEEEILSLEAVELKRRLEEDPEHIFVVDVREPHERSIVKFPQAVVIPIGQLARRKNEFNPDIDTVFICKEGKRSQLAIKTLREVGYTGSLYNLKDGIISWAKDVDKTMPIY